MSSTDKYKEGDRVFAKMKGYPAWPAVIQNRCPGKVEAYNVYFYGTYESAKVRPDCIYAYNDETKARYGKAQRKSQARFKEAMSEIENNVEIKPVDPDSEAALAPVSPQVKEEPIEEDDRELVIDESPPPPILKKEGKLPVMPTLKKAPVKKEKPVPVLDLAENIEVAEEPKPMDSMTAPTISVPPAPTKQARRKSVKRDSISLNPGTPPESTTPIVPQPELVSRSGRKIKPKRFADDEVQFGGRGSEEGKSGDATPAKRAKRTSSSGVKGTASLSPSVPTTAPLPSPVVNKEDAVAGTSNPMLDKPTAIAKRAPTSDRPVLTAKRNLKKKTTTNSANAPAKLSNVQSTGLPAVVPSRPPPPLIPIMPNLIPAPASPPHSIQSDDIKFQPAPSPKSDEVDEKSEVTDVKPKIEEGKHDQELSDRSEELKFEMAETDDEGTEKENNVGDEIPGTFENGVAEHYLDEAPIMPKRMKVDLKSGSASVVLSFNHERPHFYRNDMSSLEYDMATARSVLQTKTQLEVSETLFLKTVVDSIPVGDVEEENKMVSINDAKSRQEKIHKKIAQLRMEGEIVEIIGELIGCLGMKSSNADRALELLDRLGSRTDINPLALKKNSEVVDVIRKVQNYHGNPNEWNLPQTQLEEFHVKAEMIREKGSSIYQSFKQLFTTNAAKPFYDIFNEEKRKFNEAVEGISETTVLGLVEDPTVKIVENDGIEA